MSAQDQAFDFLVSKIPKRYGVKATVYLRALLQALASGDGYIETQVEATRDNLIAVTATGADLDRAAARYGVVRGQGTGLLDPDFQKLIPVMGSSPKQISHILLEMIDIFYGPYASHANTTCEAAEPYNIFPGQNLTIRVDDKEITVTFQTSDFVNIHAALASEVATAISNKTLGSVVGSVVSDVRTGQNFVNIRTGTIGSQGFIQVLGGSAQAELLFPEVRPVTGYNSTWSVSRYLGTDEMIYTVTSGPVPQFGAAGVQIGDYVTIRGDSGFALDNTGTFVITQVGDGFFRAVSPTGTTQVGVTNLHTNDFTFFRPDLGNVLLSSRPAALVETAPGILTIIMPVTSPVVKRTLLGGHHFHNGVSNALATTSNSITVASATAFDVAGAIRPQTSRSASQGIVSSVGSTTVNLINAANWPTQGAFWAANLRQYFYYEGISGNTLQNVTPTPPNKLAGIKVRYTERYAYTSIVGNTIQGVFPDPTNLAGKDIVSAGAQSLPNYPGSYLYDTQAQFECASNLVTLVNPIEQGQVTTLVQVNGSVASWPSSGAFVLEFGTQNQEGPIKYLSTVGTGGLIVDPSHIYKLDHPAGVGMRLVRQLGVYTPRKNGQDYAVYTTSTSPARDLLAHYLRTISAAGVQLVFEIRVPSEKWPVLPNLYTTDPMATSLVPPVI